MEDESSKTNDLIINHKIDVMKFLGDFGKIIDRKLLENYSF